MSSAEVTSPEVLTKDEVVINLEEEEANLRPRKRFPFMPFQTQSRRKGATSRQFVFLITLFALVSSRFSSA